MQKRISIITPVFNSGKLLLSTSESIKKQTYQNFEWILIDDGSTDKETIRIINSICNINLSTRIIKHEINKGLSAARNTGILNAHTDYLFFLDADDLIDPTFLEKAFLFLELQPEFAFVNSYVKGFGAQNYSWQGGFHDKEQFLFENRNTSCFLARKEVFIKIKFDESMLDGCEDWDFWLHAASKGFWGYTIPEYLFFYRRSDISKWSTLKGKQELAATGEGLRKKYGGILKEKGFPKPQHQEYVFGNISFVHKH